MSKTIPLKNYGISLGARCDLCPLSHKQPIPPPEPLDPTKVRLVVVSEPIGRGEESLRVHVAGRSGGLLATGLKKHGLTIGKDIYLTSMTLCRPEGDKEAKKAAECCAPRVLREIAGYNVPLLVLGKEAFEVVMGGRKHMYARGFVWTLTAPLLKTIKAWEKAYRKSESETKRAKGELKCEIARLRRKIRDRWAVVSLAPSFISRADTWAPILTLDLKRMSALLNGLIIGGGGKIGGLSESGHDLEGQGVFDDYAPHTVWPGVTQSPKCVGADSQSGRGDGRG